MHLIRIIGFSALLLGICVGCGGKPTSESTPTPEKDFKGTKVGSTPTATKSHSENASTTNASTTGIEGDYTIVGFSMWGKDAPPEEIAKFSDKEKTVKIKKDTIEFYPDDKKMETLKYKLDPSKSPMEIETTPIEKGKEDPKDKSYGIYKIEGDTLKIFLMGAKDPKNRPKEFKTVGPLSEKKDIKETDGGAMYVVLKKK